MSHQAYGAMCGGGAGFIGGIEWQTSLMAKWFAKRGHRVSLLTWNEGGPAEEIIDGVRVIKLCPQAAGIKGLRFFHPKWTKLVHAMSKANADIYYQNGGECTTGQVAFWCRSHHKSFVFATASDADCTPGFPELARHDRLFYRFGLKLADRLVTQTATQADRLRDLFGLDSVVIPMPCPQTARDFVQPSPRRGRILWVGRICQVKRPDRLLEVAVLCPELSFDLAGPFQDKAWTADIQERASGIPNVTLHGAIARERMPEFYRNAALLCCTSDYEGFPNTFLEAWSHGLPVVSTIDPDGVVVRHRLGAVVKDMREMQSNIRSLLAAPQYYVEISRNARRYFMENHEADAVLPRFEQLFLQTIRQNANELK
ncbi:MAG: glycosyltransferase family 4 protein [Limisphaerales bacterium]